MATGSGTQALHPGANVTRELERSAAFLGAQFASEGATGFDIAALLFELRDVVAGMADAEDTAALSRLSVADAARREWREATAAQEATAREAAAELRRRGAEPGRESGPETEAEFLERLSDGFAHRGERRQIDRQAALGRSDSFLVHDLSARHDAEANDEGRRRDKTSGMMDGRESHARFAYQGLLIKQTVGTRAARA